MKLYTDKSERFCTDMQLNRISEKLRNEYVAQIGHRPAPSDVSSWPASLMALSMPLRHEAF